MMMMAVAAMTCLCQVRNPHIRHDPINLYHPTNGPRVTTSNNNCAGTNITGTIMMQ